MNLVSTSQSQLVLLLLMRFTQLWAFSRGPPLRTCENLFPRHRGFQAQLGPSPYIISVSNNSYIPGESLTLTISGSNAFKGFILQVRSNDSSIAWPVGEFTQIPEGAKTIFCSGGEPKNTAGHHNLNGTDWSSREFTWKAPTKSVGNVTFIATIVKDYATYWVKVASPVITGPPTENVTRGVPSESFQIDKTGCGKTKGCYSVPSTCTGSGDCNYLFTYKITGGNVTIEMSAKERYASVGFNERKLMDKMDCIMCATLASNFAELRHYGSNHHRLDRKTLPDKADMSLEKIVYEDGRIKCRLIRKLNSSIPHFRDLTKKWYILFAHGTTSPTGIGQNHRRMNRTNTAGTVDISVPATLAAEQSQIKDTITKDGCGKTKSCYSEPENCKAMSTDCGYLVTIKPLKGGDGQGKTDEVEFEISSKAKWASIGFNKEKKMPDTDALICANREGKIYVDHYVADQGYGTPTKTTPTTSSIVKILAETSGGVTSCRFRRKRRDPENPKMLDLNEPLYQVYTSGPMNGDLIGKHSTDPKVSTQKVNIDEIGVLSAEGKDSSKIKAHGCLMVVAWIGFASIGIFMARYMKTAFGEKQLMGTKMWFAFHRALMILTVVLTIISVIIIFVDAGRWTDEAGAHPITGIIVLVLAVIQPIMALFRPHPGEKNRYIFNWAHRGVGFSALIVAVVTIFLGIRLDGTGLDNSALYVMSVYCVSVALLLVFEVYLPLNKKKTASYKSGKGDKEGGHVELESTEDQSIPARKLMLGFQVLLIFAVVVALMVLIATADTGAHDQHQ